MPKISVVIPTYNRVALLPKAIESVLGQTLSVHEVVVSDDGSTDSTKTLVDDYIKKYPHVSIRYIYQRQLGSAAARNAGIGEATGDWIAFLDSDDYWLPDKLEWQMRALERFAGACNACVTDGSYANNPLLKKTAFEQVGIRHDSVIGVWPNAARSIAYGHAGIYLQTLVVGSNIVRSVGGFDPSFRLCEDTDFLFRLACRTGICYVAKPLVEIDRTPERTVGLIELAKDEQFRLQLAQNLYEKWLQNDSEFGPDVRERILRRLQHVHAGWSSWHLISRDYEKALSALSEALHYDLNSKIASKWLLTRLAPRLARSIVIAHRKKTHHESFY